MKRSLVKTFLITVILISAAAVFSQTSGKEVKLSPAEKKLMNTFFSNFSEVLMEPFTRESITDMELIQFAVSHNYRNNEKLFTKGGEEYQVKIRARYIDDTVNKFFGRKIIQPQSIEGIDYKDGWYYTTDASGEEYLFSQIVSLHDNGNGIFTAKVNVFQAGSGWTGNVHGDEKEWRKSSPDDVPEVLEVMEATLRKVKEKGKSRYILTDYVKVK